MVAIYSSFLQRAYDQILHDVALQKLPVIFAIDRAGIVGSDGPTHHGAFDLSYLRNIPNLTLMAPRDENELGHMLFTAVSHNDGPVAIRYPRGSSLGVKVDRKYKKIKIGKAEKLHAGEDGAILAIGCMVNEALAAAKELKEQGINVSVYDARFVKPMDRKMIEEAASTGKILTVEENVLEGGFGSAVLEELERQKISNVKVSRIGLRDFVEHGDPNILREKCGLSQENIIKEFLSLK